MKEGDIVRILKLSDDVRSLGQRQRDECAAYDRGEEPNDFGPRFGQLGIVKSIKVKLDWPVGQSSGDPLIFVRFKDGKSDAFWTEELQIVKERYEQTDRSIANLP